MPAGTPVINALAAGHRLRCPGQLRALALRRLALGCVSGTGSLAPSAPWSPAPITCKRPSGHFLQGTTRTTRTTQDTTAHFQVANQRGTNTGLQFPDACEDETARQHTRLGSLGWRAQASL